MVRQPDTSSFDSNGGDIFCAFCGLPPERVTAMISGPNGIYICDKCLTSSIQAMKHDLGIQLDIADLDDQDQVFDAAPYAKNRPGFFEPSPNWQKPSQTDFNQPGFGQSGFRRPGFGQPRNVSPEAENFGSDPQSFSPRHAAVVESFIDDAGPTPAEVLASLPTPHEIHGRLTEHVVGQEDAKRALSVAVYNHYKRISLGAVREESDVELAKSNIMLLGPTGSGKTLLAQTLARILQVPFAIADATTLTEAGYVGEDVENILLKLITAADFDIGRAEIGIVYIDEIDKIARKAENLSITRDVSGEGVQQALLKIVEGCEASVPPQGGRKHPQQELIHIDTTNILFILGGAFVGLADIIGQRVGKRGLGFATELPESKKHEEAELLAQVLPEDLHKFGMIPEFVGRIPVITSLSELNEEDLVRILTEPKNALVKQYTRMFEFENSKLVFEPEALRAIAHEAVNHGTGARGLRSICERVLMNIMYDLPEHKEGTTVIIRATDITGETLPKIVPVDGSRAVEENDISDLAV